MQSAPEVLASIFRPVKSNTVSPAAHHSCVVSVLPRLNAAEMGPASRYRLRCNIASIRSFDFVCFSAVRAQPGRCC